MRTPPVITRSALFGSTRIWLKYIGRTLFPLVLCHDAPASSERYTPLSPGALPADPPLRAPAGASASICA